MLSRLCGWELNYRFGSDTVNPDLFTKGPSALDMGWFVVHGQTTFIEQYAAPFRAPYSGVNSLASNAGRETWDATLAAGFKLWQGAALGSIRRSTKVSG